MKRRGVTQPIASAANAKYAAARRRQVLGIIRSLAVQGKPMLTGEDIGEILGLPPQRVRAMISRLEQEGELRAEAKRGHRHHKRRVTLKTGEATDWSAGRKTWSAE